MNALNNLNGMGNGMGGNPLTNFFSMMGQFNSFRNNFQGDPRAQVQSLLQSGKMTQEQFNQISQLANQIRPMIR